jgi:hypothetical protein
VLQNVSLTEIMERLLELIPSNSLHTVSRRLSSREVIIYMPLVQNDLIDRELHQYSRIPYSEQGEVSITH